MKGKKYMRREVPWWVWFICIDSILVVNSVLLVYFPRDAFVSEIAYYAWANLSLSAEMTFAVWWSGLSILLVGLVCYENFSESKGLDRFAWLVLSVLFTLLSLDEIGSIHERALESGVSMLIFVFIGSLFLLPAFGALIYNEKTRETGILIFIGASLMASVALQEFVEHSVSWSASEWAVRMGIEEGSEIFGALICLVGTVKCRKRVDWPSQISRAIPNPLRMYRLPHVIAGALISHIVLSLCFFNRLDFSTQGDPFVFFPCVIFILLSAYAYWDFFENDLSRYNIKLLYSLVFLSTSLSSFYFLSETFGLLGERLRLITCTSIGLSIIVFSLAYNHCLNKRYSLIKTNLVLCGFLILIFSLYSISQKYYYVLYAIFSTIIYVTIVGVGQGELVTQE
jgi:hypothetical protein